MNTYFRLVWLVSSLLLGLMACSKDTPEVGKPSPGLTEEKSFTDADATAAFNTFHNTFFDNDKKLYYNNTNRNEIAQGWTQAVFFDIVVNNYLRTKENDDLQLIQQVYEGAYNTYAKFNWEQIKTVNDFIYDDMMWWVISLARAYQVTNNATYLTNAQEGFDFVWDESYDPMEGGMRWSWKVEGKNACINYPTVIAAMILYDITQNESYLDKAKNIYSWSHKNLFDAALGQVADHKVGDNPPGFEDYTYNQGTCIGAATLLYQTTKDEAYLKHAQLAADYTKNKMCDVNGILPAEGDWNEQGVLKAIFAQYIHLLINTGEQEKYFDWIEKNINMGWQNRDTRRELTYRDYTVPCPTGQLQSYEASSIVAFMQLFSPSVL